MGRGSGGTYVGLDDNVAGLACGLGAHNALDRLNAGLERSLVVVRVERHLALLQLQRHRRLGNLGRGRLGPDGHSAARAGAASDLLGVARDRKGLDSAACLG
eukprot:361808-Chlamydomonas_euryale.AAC.18